MEAIRRPNRLVGGARLIEAVLDIIVPFFEAQRIAASRSEDNLRIPDTSDNTFVCIAAYYLLQCNIRQFGAKRIASGQQPDKRGRRKPAASETFSRVAYSAATFRGGARGPESWVSGNWGSVKARARR